MIMNHKEAKAICVLGMHRSGTSTVTRGLNLLGAYLGEENDLMKPLPENPEGFWERYDIYYLQNRILATMKRDWDATAPLPEGWHRSAEISPLKEELVALVKEKFCGKQLWAWKDPRTCLLLPLWKDVLAELGIELKILFVVRNPIDVARSLEKRNGFTLAKGLGIWFNHTITALKEAEGLDTVFLSYDSFLDSWETDLKRCAAGLALKWPVDEISLQTEMVTFMRRDLRHSVSGTDELIALKPPEPVIRLYMLLLDILSGNVALHAAAKMTKSNYQEFTSYAQLFEYDMAALADCRKLLEEKAVSTEMLPAFTELEKELDSRTEWAWKLNYEVKLLREQVASLKNTGVPLVFIIVLNWNGKDDTIECLSTLKMLDYPNFEIMVIDNGSTDGSEETIRSSFPSVYLIQTGKNLGYAGGNNAGIRYALEHGADYVWLLNNDTTVDPNALTVLVKTVQADPKIAFVGSKIYYYDQPNVIWCVGGMIDLAAGGRTDHPGMGQKDLGQFETIDDVGYVSGCSLLASRSAIKAIGLLPEEYFLYFEEADWNVAAQRQGYRTVLAPASQVWHKYADVGEYKDRFIYYSFRNRIQIVRKYAPRHVFKAIKVNMDLLAEHISNAPERALSLRWIAFLAHFDALLFRTGKARWHMLCK